MTVAMTPYYSKDGITIYHGDCREILPTLPKVDLVLTDPPYGIALKNGTWSGGDYEIAGDESTCLRDEVLGLCVDTPAAVFGTWKVPRPEGTVQCLIWDKTDGTGPGMGDLGLQFGLSHEEIYLIGNWPKVAKRRGSVIRTRDGIRALAVSLGHPTPKPLSLVETLLGCTAARTILDPFMGSGTTLVAAKNLGRRAIGIEIEEKYCEIAVKRLAQGVLM